MYTLMQSNVTHDTCFTHDLLFTCFASCRNVLIILCCLYEEEEPTMSFKLIENLYAIITLFYAITNWNENYLLLLDH